MAITNFFIRRPCIAIITPYVILLILSVIAFSQQMFDVYIGQEDSLVFSDPIIIDDNIIKIAKDDLNRKEAKIDKLREDELEDQVRYEKGPMTSVLMLYEDVSTTAEGKLYGLLNKESIIKVVEME
jgi:hypothetical protein